MIDLADESRCVLYPCRRMRILVGVAAAMLANKSTPTECFNALQSSGSSNSRTRSVSRTALAFKETNENSATFFSSNTFTVNGSARIVDSLRSLDSIKPPSAFGKVRLCTDLPTWLSFDNSDLKDANINALSEFMRDSFFTEKEIQLLLNAIQDASGDDAHKSSGAAEFCLLLAETMEMGLDALTAAAFHYCSCVNAREKASNHGTGNRKFDDAFGGNTLTNNYKIEQYGSKVAEIEADAARLKQLELVASSVFAHSQRRSGRVTPGKHDAENLRHLLLTETKDWRALAIRSAACLYRLRGILKAEQPNLTPEFVRTSREALSIYAPLSSRLGMHRLKNELEGAAFRILYRRQYEAVTSLQTLSPSGQNVHGDLGESMGLVLELVKADVTRILEDDAEFQRQVGEFSVSARVKEPYSMWKKMLRLGYKHILQVPDALALRVVLNAKKLSRDEAHEVTQARERALCYYAQKLCQSEFKPVRSNPRFKDYIAKPKRNGYQSLHYTATTHWEGEEWSLEVQVRSGAMHGVAEFGIACHCDYKAKDMKSDSERANLVKADDDIDKSSDAYLRNLQKWRREQHGVKTKMLETLEPVVTSDMWHSRGREKWFRNRSERLKPYLQALTDVQSDLVRDHVFVFLTQEPEESDNNNYPIAGEGKVLALPAGACVLDALRESERTLGLSLVRNHGFAVNGIETSVTRQLQNGDILGIQRPTRTAVAA